MKPISNTAFYCCGVRMEDAERASPICGDIYAKVFMDEQGLQIYDFFKSEANTNISIIARHRIIDDLLRQALSVDPNQLVITIGAGFDSRPYRLGGGRWVELDEPQVVAHKDARLPVSACSNPLTRVAVDFLLDSLEEKLAAFACSEPVVFVIEGVFIYLDQEQMRKLFAVLHTLFPNHTLICDLVTRQLVEQYGSSLHQKIKKIGATFKPVDDPWTIFTSSGYRFRELVSIIEKAVDFESARIPKFFLKFFLSPIASSNSIYVFEFP
jgi:methyltransferase (TIGR00027 family)